MLSAAAAHPPAAIIHTDIRRDGMMSGVDAAAMAAAAEKSPCPLIVSGGVCGEDDARALSAAHANIGGVIVGRAAYENPPDAGAAAKNLQCGGGRRLTFARGYFFGKTPLFELQAQWKTAGRFFSADEILYTSPKAGADIVSVVIVAGRK